MMMPVLLIAGKPKFCIKVKFNGLADTTCYLGNYYGDKQYIKDTARIDSKGNCVFQGDEELSGGIYFIVLPSKKYFEIIINKEPFFSVESDTIDFADHMKIKGSEENQLFYEYLRYINVKQKEDEPLRNSLKKTKDKDSLDQLQKKHDAIEKEVQKYKLDFIDKHPETFLAKVFKSSYEPELPEAPLLANGKKDSVFIYRYYKKHFLDYIDFSDDRILRTPIFHNKLKQYFTTLVIQHPDSIIKEADLIINLARANKEMFKYVVWYVTNWSETSNIMGFDAIFVHMVEKYYMTNQAFWVSASNLEKINNRAKVLKNLLLGGKIPNITAQDTNGVYVTLYNVKAKYTILYFWDPDCGHCQKETPKLIALLDSLKNKNVAVYALCATQKFDEWKKYIIENKLNWINVMDIQGTTGYKTTYDIYSTPVVYLLDENKKILAKRLSADQVRDFLNMQIKKDETQK
jgi:peroxiredoxin